MVVSTLAALPRPPPPGGFRRRPDSLIKYLGCHSIRLPLNTCKVYFVVMANVLPQRRGQRRMDVTFDLKGATSNRQRVRGKSLEALTSGAVPPGAFKTLLDKDWIALSTAPRYRLGLRLPDDGLAQLRSIIRDDAAFLAAQVIVVGASPDCA